MENNIKCTSIPFAIITITFKIEYRKTQLPMYAH